MWIAAHPEGPLAKAGVKKLIGRTVHYDELEFVNVRNPCESRSLGVYDVYFTTRSPY